MFDNKIVVPFSFVYEEEKYFLHRRNLRAFNKGETELLLYSTKDNQGFIIDISKLNDLIEQGLVTPSYNEDELR